MQMTKNRQRILGPTDDSHRGLRPCRSQVTSRTAGINEARAMLR